jgi:hypothetical protein
MEREYVRNADGIRIRMNIVTIRQCNFPKFLQKNIFWIFEIKKLESENSEILLKNILPWQSTHTPTLPHI